MGIWYEKIPTIGCKKNWTMQKNWNHMAQKLEELDEGQKVELHIDLLRMTLKISNWKKASHRIHGFWLQKFTTIHIRLALEINKYLRETHKPKRMTKGKTTPIQKYTRKGVAQNNYRPITCLPMICKIPTAQIRK